MKTIAFYISDHGFGHIMRNISVIAYVLEHTENIILLVSGNAHIAAAKEYIEKYTNAENLNKRFITIEQHTDIGFALQSGTLLVDWTETEKRVREYISEFPKYIKNAREIFRKYKVDTVVCDIVPWALTAAGEEGLPSYLMASFTWVEQYEQDLPPELVKEYRKAYDSADNVILYGLHTPFAENTFKNCYKVSLCARTFHSDKVREIIERYGDKPIVFISIGMSNDGIKGIIDVSDLPYSFIVTEGVNLTGENVHKISKTIDNTQDYVMASDYCIAKAGWTTISEILIAKKPMALLSRPDVAEDSMYIEKLINENLAVEITVEELRNISDVLNRIKSITQSQNNYQDDTDKIADIICSNVVKCI